jgi:hypothetical protein
LKSGFQKKVCRVLPFMVAAAFVATECVPKINSFLGVLTFVLAGLGCGIHFPDSFADL